MSDIYIAAPWFHRDTARGADLLMRIRGHRLRSTWYFSQAALDPGGEFQAFSHQAQQDLRDLDDADTLIVLNLAMSEGKAVELGYALAEGKAVYVVGERSSVNIFHFLPEVGVFATLEEALDDIEEKE